jgi:hypothetical protein
MEVAVTTLLLLFPWLRWEGVFLAVDVYSYLYLCPLRKDGYCYCATLFLVEIGLLLIRHFTLLLRFLDLTR